MSVAPTQAAHQTGDQAAHPARDVVADRLADPEVAGALASLLDHAELLAVLVEGLDQFVARSEVIGDSLLAGVTEMRQGIAGGESMLDGLGVDLPRIAETATRLARSDLVDPAAVDSVSLMARGLMRGAEDFESRPVAVTGVVSLMKAMKDPDVRRALSYFVTVAKAMGRELETS